MDKFNDSERILDKNLFKQEYYKELNKGKRVIARLRKWFYYFVIIIFYLPFIYEKVQKAIPSLQLLQHLLQK